MFKAKAQKDKEIKREDCSNILQAREQMAEWLLTWETQGGCLTYMTL